MVTIVYWFQLSLEISDSEIRYHKTMPLLLSSIDKSVFNCQNRKVITDFVSKGSSLLRITLRYFNRDSLLCFSKTNSITLAHLADFWKRGWKVIFIGIRTPSCWKLFLFVLMIRGMCGCRTGQSEKVEICHEIHHNAVGLLAAAHGKIRCHRIGWTKYPKSSKYLYVMH